MTLMFSRASETPMLTTIFFKRGACMAFFMENRLASSGATVWK